MAYNYKFTEEADQDLDEIYNYYEDLELGLGKRFIINLFKQIDRITIKPDAYSADQDNIRKTKVKDFKYYIYYTIRNPIVLVIAVWHTAREPFDKNKRLPKSDISPGT